jgi:predicted kinase
MQLLIATVGAQGSGKTTWTMKEVDKYRIGTVGRVNRDQIRIMSHGGYKGSASQEYQVTLAQNALVETYLRSGLDVIVDDTNMRGLVDIGRWLEVADRFRVDLQVVDFLDIPIEECVRRNDLRLVGRVPVKAIHKTWSGFRESFPGDPDREDHEVVAEFRASVQNVERVSRYTKTELTIMI